MKYRPVSTLKKPSDPFDNQRLRSAMINQMMSREDEDPISFDIALLSYAGFYGIMHYASASEIPFKFFHAFKMDGRYINVNFRPNSPKTDLAEALSVFPLVTVLSFSEEGAPLVEIYVKRPECSTGKLSIIKLADRDYACRIYKDIITQRYGQGYLSDK